MMLTCSLVSLSLIISFRRLHRRNRIQPYQLNSSVYLFVLCTSWALSACSALSGFDTLYYGSLNIIYMEIVWCLTVLDLLLIGVYQLLNSHWCANFTKRIDRKSLELFEKSSWKYLLHKEALTVVIWLFVTIVANLLIIVVNAVIGGVFV